MFQKLNEVYDPLTSNVGIFKELFKLNSNSTWLTVDVANTLDLDYYLGFSLNKFISPLFDNLINQDKDTALTKIAKIINTRFMLNWNKTYDAYVKAYEPLENYSMEEVETPNLVESRTSNRNESANRNSDNKSTINNNKTSESKHSINIQNSGNTESGLYGFNSSKSLPSNNGNSTNITLADLESNKTLNNDVLNESHVDNSKETSTLTGSANDEIHHTGNRMLTRKGNIGVTTSQQMLESEIKLRKYDFYKRLMMDVDSVMCLKSY